MSRWQFSIRGMLLFTALVAMVLAFAVRLPDIFRFALVTGAIVLLLVAILKSANFATSDRRPRMSTVTWLLLGTFFWIYAAGVYYSSFVGRGAGSAEEQALLMIMVSCGVISYYRAGRAFADACHRSARIEDAGSGDQPEPSERPEHR